METEYGHHAMMQSYLLLRKQIKGFLVTDRKYDPMESEAVN